MGKEKIEFIVEPYDNLFILSIGDETIYSADSMDEEELIAFYDDYIEDVGDEIEINENGEKVYDFDNIKEIHRDLEISNGIFSNYQTPYGRAVEFFQDFKLLKIVKEIGIKIVDGESPGNDFAGVFLTNSNQTESLKRELLKLKVDVNFIINKLEI